MTPQKTQNPASEFTPSLDQHNALNNLFIFFNQRLFDNKLPRAMLNFSRHAKCYGFFTTHKVWKRDDAEGFHEISLNPDTCLNRPPVEYCSTLVHEMVHLWQSVHGKPTAGYHNKEFCEKMLTVGLQPVDKKGNDKMSAKQMSHRLLPQFHDMFREVPSYYLLPLIAQPLGEEAKKKKAAKNKSKYTCLSCSTSIWGKPSLRVFCADCVDPENEDAYVLFVEETPEEKEEN